MMQSFPHHQKAKLYYGSSLLLFVGWFACFREPATHRPELTVVFITAVTHPLYTQDCVSGYGRYNYMPLAGGGGWGGGHPF